MPLCLSKRRSVHGAKPQCVNAFIAATIWGRADLFGKSASGAGWPDADVAHDLLAAPIVRTNSCRVMLERACTSIQRWGKR